MAKETVRYPDALVARIEALVDGSTAFESKSEYHRFASEFLLSLLEPEHEPSVLGYGEIFDELDVEREDVFGGSDAETEQFLETYIRVRRHLLHGELDEARTVIDETYDVADREALLLDELVGQFRGVGHDSTATGVPPQRTVGPRPRGLDARSADGTGRSTAPGSNPNPDADSDPDSGSGSSSTPDSTAGSDTRSDSTPAPASESTAETGSESTTGRPLDAERDGVDRSERRANDDAPRDGTPPIGTEH
jgi:Arc/MetJ-type ribon-helix-helix transcriptional regulator